VQCSVYVIKECVWFCFGQKFVILILAVNDIMTRVTWVTFAKTPNTFIPQRNFVLVFVCIFICIL